MTDSTPADDDKKQKAQVRAGKFYAGLMMLLWIPFVSDCAYKNATDRQCDAAFCWSTQVSPKAVEVTKVLRVAEVGRKQLWYCSEHNPGEWRTYGKFGPGLLAITLIGAAILGVTVFRD